MSILSMKVMLSFLSWFSDTFLFLLVSLKRLLRRCASSVGTHMNESLIQKKKVQQLHYIWYDTICMV